MQSDFLEHHLIDQLNQQEVYDDFFWHRVRWEAVSSVFPKSSRFNLLDIGAGTGQVGRFLQKGFKSGQYNFIEPLSVLNSNLRANFGGRGDYSNKETYIGINIITCLDVIEHVDDDKVFIKEILKKSEVGTRLIFTVPAMNILWSEWDSAMGHYRRYNKTDLKRLFLDENVRINRINYLFPEMFFAAILRRIFLKSNTSKGSEFPKLGNFSNNLLFRLGNLTRKLGALSPFGSSLIIDVTKN